MNKISIIRNDQAFYPDKETNFRPRTAYPEYIFPSDLSDRENYAYEMIRAGLHMLGLDRENYGTEKWNPLKHYVHPGDNVLIKPNMVLHFNSSGGGTDCLYTNPALVAAMVDYVLIALEGKGKIVIGDAPVQECVFDTLVKNSGYDILVDFYRRKNIDVSLVDYRNVKTQERDGLHYLQEDEGNRGIIVKLDDGSAFSDVPEEHLRKLRITNYDPRILQKHHYGEVHEYKVAEEVLNADVIINMPKPKTHRKAGVTISLKNLLGINTNKEFLPHHTVGSYEEGGDAYRKTNQYLEMANNVLDIKNMLVHEGETALASLANQLYEKLRAKKACEEYWEGSWYGNDTIWRTILDLNTILFYADKNGRRQETRQRRMFIAGDMIVSGEEEGPLEPTPTYPHSIVMGDDPVLFDMAVCSLMGFDYQDIPSISMPGMDRQKSMLTEGGLPQIVSNYARWDNCSLDDLRDHYSLKFQPSRGWTAKLGNPRFAELLHLVRENGNRVYIFGAGENGLFMAKELQKEGVQIEAFCDNNKKLQNRAIIHDIMCIAPQMIDREIPIVVAVSTTYVDEVKTQVQELGGKIIPLHERNVCNSKVTSREAACLP